MAENHDYLALDWVRGEIEQTLSQARVALEAFVDNKDDTTQITFCLNHIHQVHGTLQMVEFYGAALLAEEMEKLCQAILDDNVAMLNEALEVLMESLLQLENYLDHIQSGQRDLPVVLLPILNDLRALQGQPLLSDTSLFTPNLESAFIIPRPEHNDRLQDEQVQANLRKLRQMFQFSLAGIIRNQELANNFANLYRVLARLEKFCNGTPLGKIWWVAVGYLDAIQDVSVGLSSAPKQLLRELDHQIKLMLDEHTSILSRPVPEDLLKNLLYYVAKTHTTSRRIEELKAAFDLEAALPSAEEVDQERERMQGPGKETMASVVDVLSEELNQVKEQLDLYVRSSTKDNEGLLELVPSLNQVANTMAVLGLGVARKHVLKQIEKIEEIAAKFDPATDQELMDMAGALLYIEANLATLKDDQQSEIEQEDGEFVVPTEQFEDAHNAVIVESRNGLEQAKNNIVSFIASQWDHAEIEDVPSLLDTIRGGLQIIPLPRAASLLEACSNYIRDKILSDKSVPDWEQLDRLADAITSIEYYMERLSEGAKDNERVLQIAEESISKLGFGNETAAQETSSPVLSEHHVAEVAAESPDAIVKESDENLIDEEILGIFIEESAEVMEEIQAAMAQLKTDAENLDTLKDLRRAFHTLKGSGRLVGAAAIGELAWSIENLLNKFLDKRQPLSFGVFDLLDSVISRLPALTDDFANQRDSENYEHLISQAELLLNEFLNGGTSEAAIPATAEPEPEPLLEQASEPEEAEPETPTEDVSIDEPIEEEVAPVADIESSEPSAEMDDDDLIDEEILEIFIEEAGEVLETISEYLPTFVSEPDNKEALTELRRAFHTLKGSGRMVGAEDIGETAWGIENMLNRVIDGTILMNQDIIDVVKHVVDLIPGLIENFKTNTKPEVDLAAIQARCDALSKGDLVPSLSESASETGSEDSAETSTAAETKEAQELEFNLGIDAALLEIFESEASGHVKTVIEFAHGIEEGQSYPINDALSRALHTLKGSANTASIKPIAEITIPVEKFIKEARARGVEVNSQIAEMLIKGMDLVNQGMARLHSEPQAPIEGSEAFLDLLKQMHQDMIELSEGDSDLLEDSPPDPQLISIFLTEGLDILLDAEQILNDWSENPVSGDALGQLISEVKTLHKGAQVAGLESIAELCDCLEDCYGTIDGITKEPDSTFLADIKSGHDALIDMMDQVAAGLTAVPDNKLLAKLREHVLSQQTDLANTPASLPTVELEEEELEELEPEAIEVNETEDADVEEELFEGSILDPELAEIFLEEAREIINGIRPALDQLAQADANHEQTLIHLQRDLHTLKGGARLAEINSIGDLAHCLEAAFERLVVRKTTPGENLYCLFEEAESRLSGMLKSIEAQSAPEAANDLVEQLEAESRAEFEPAVEEETKAEEQPAPATSETAAAPEPQFDEEAFELDPELVEIFLEEAQDIIENSGSLLHQWESDTQNNELVGELQRELHTLKGGARMAEINAIGDLSHELETLFERIVDQRFSASEGMVELCLACHDALASMVDSVGSGQAAKPAVELLAQIKQVVETGQISDITDTTEAGSVPGETEEFVEEVPEAPVVEPEEEIEEQPLAKVSEPEETPVTQSAISPEDLEGDLIQLFLDESKDILTTSAEYIEHWQEDEEGLDGVVELQREMHTLKGGARLADMDAIAEVAGALEDRLGQMLDGLVTDTKILQESVAKAHKRMVIMLEQLISGEVVQSDIDLIKEITSAGGTEQSITEVAEPKETQKPAATQQTPEWLTDLGEDVDEEVIEMFVEEAGELIEALEVQISEWNNAPESEEPNREIQRILHTLKGGARLSSLSKLADESHDLETKLISALNAQQKFEGDFKQTVLDKQDVLLKLVDDLQKFANGEAIAETPVPQPVKEEAKQKAKAPAKVDKAPGPSKPATKPAASPSPTQKTAAKSAPQETIRVSAGLLEELVNLAGETSISRGRLEQQISDFGFTLEEMSATIERLREQLRRLEMETEAQVLFTAEKEGLNTSDEYEDFDPLEMDRYSSIQQLSRALTESTTDLLELRETLANRSRDAETILLQQSRITSELQEGLMKTRMIPFSSMVPRLRRIVRQISGELNKQVEFDVLNAEGEMDRSIMERMIAPLEHMLRNALDHGIETTANRKKAGKNEKGTITLSLAREGGDIVLRMKDDGGGINDQAVLKKAINQGLVKKSAKPTHNEILQFIMLPGFSTAEKITQISGRGVGMDVVASEIKQMGGTLGIESTFGEGTEFSVRLPFTVSVNRALMVNTGEDFYAIPLNTIEGIVRVSPYELEEYYKPDAPLYEYAGRKYQLKYLGKLLHSSHQPKLQGQPLPLPVILVRGADQPMALQVDSLMGSREIVVKSLGPQFGGVNGVSGATILGDGSVVVILDLPALIRDDIAGLLDVEEAQEVATVEDQRAKLVMVVDDSVTVRKVTTRLLERNGMDVITAKDGVDAIAQLQDHKPDVMLLDIEMPRMDGFEVATLVRHDERLKDVPIIMITSRTGQKHRERALGIGVNEYLGKPFQEQDLLKNIERLTRDSD